MCAICDDERQWVPRGGQQWTTLGELAKHYSVATFPMEPGLTGLIVEPETGIGQRAIVVEHPDGNVLWDPIGLITPAAISAVEQLGGVRWVAASHPHMYGVQVEWANAFDARVLVQRKDAEWVGRASERIELVDGTVELADGLTIHRFGGHFPGASVLHVEAGADGRGVLLAGDTIQPKPDGTSVAFMRSYPNNIPLSGAVVRRVADRAIALDFARLYGNFATQWVEPAHASIEASAARHIAWVRGDFDHLTD